MDLVIPDPSKSLAAGAVDPWTKPNYDWGLEEFLCAQCGPDPDRRPLRGTATRRRKALLSEGIRKFFHDVERKKYKVHVRVFLARYRGYTECSACGGARLREDALFVRVGGQTIASVAQMNVAESLAFFDGRSWRRNRPRSPAGFWSRSGSGCSSCTTSAWITSRSIDSR